jgi:phage terminase small subunit
MAGMKGRSGGARPNSGPKPKPKAPELPLAAVEGQSPLDFLLSVQNDPAATPALRVRAAVAAAQYLHTKRHDGGKKDEAEELAKAAAKGKYAPKAAPKLVVNNR